MEGVRRKAIVCAFTAQGGGGRRVVNRPPPFSGGAHNEQACRRSTLNPGTIWLGFAGNRARRELVKTTDAARRAKR
ncbi:hypothetical protein KCP74_14325 [Salmonella enterica subsp. enterica]|nr:hypothetical protein KCP74_14325 [Salmonella enterica subsp. enterica]